TVGVAGVTTIVAVVVSDRPDHGTQIDDLERSPIVEDKGGAGMTVRAGVPQRRPGGAVDDQVAIALQGRISARVAVGPRVPDDLAARPVFDQVAVILHDQLVLAVRRMDGLAGGQDSSRRRGAVAVPEGRAVGLVDHGIAIVLELEVGAGMTIRAGPPQRRPGGAVDDQVAIALHGRRSARVAVGPRVPDDLAARAVFDQVAVRLPDPLVLALRP